MLPKEVKIEADTLFKQGIKRCSKCFKIKKLCLFYKRKLCADGYNGMCMECVRSYKNSIKESLKTSSKKYYTKKK